MSTLIQKILALFSPAEHAQPASANTDLAPTGMPLASATYLREFAKRLGLEVDDLSPAEQDEMKSRLDRSMDFREENYGFLYHEVYQLGHGYSLADASRVSAQINGILEEPAARAYFDYRENAVAAEALMAAGSLLEQEGDAGAAARLFDLADTRRHRSSVLALNVADGEAPGFVRDEGDTAEKDKPAVDDGTPIDVEPNTEVDEDGLEGLMDTTVGTKKPAK
ncbi:hypothetical protein [Arthrobacter sp. AQ5-05]|uniref:hypothetical protein n=1 Tax=Arthrobacter sp. AQ5-05 TaxID=2184581 RepID=UPI0012B625AA|nr:hypothetical protein [Arthrobacter sp. AQ5-05]